MRNLGATCFLNVVLQSLLAVPQLREYFLSDRHNAQACPSRKADSTNDSPCLCCEFDTLFSEVRYDGSLRTLSLQFTGSKNAAIPYAPARLMSAMWKASTSSELAGYAEQDAHEFLISCTCTLNVAS